MPPLVIAQLLAQFGLPLVQQLFALHAAGKTVTQADFDELVKLAAYRSTDSLKAAGIQIVDGRVVPL